jgi:hypothetical protein
LGGRPRGGCADFEHGGEEVGDGAVFGHGCSLENDSRRGAGAQRRRVDGDYIFRHNVNIWRLE